MEVTNPVGRPSLYKEEYCDDLVNYIKTTRKSFIHWCNTIQVHRDTLPEWCKKYPKFSVAFKLAKQIHLEKCFDMMDEAETPVEFNKAKWYMGACHRINESAPLEDNSSDDNGATLGFADLKKPRNV